MPCSDTILEIAKPTSEKNGLSVTDSILLEDEIPQSSKHVASACLLITPDTVLDFSFVC